MKKLFIIFLLTLSSYALAGFDEGRKEFEKENFREAYRIWKIEADNGDLVSKYNVALMLIEGVGVEKSVTQGLTELVRVGKAGFPEAQYTLGLFFMNGQYFHKDSTKAVSWFKKAAESDVADYQYFLGLLFFSGDMVDKNYRKSEEWFLRAASKGHALAQAHLGKIYSNGFLGEPDYLKSYVYYFLSITNGNNEPALQDELQKIKARLSEKEIEKANQLIQFLKGGGDK